ncbi:hypothetical protein Goklo_029684, partial [Gossypium klotzschianum]|nr:hypothetical protein [Gossypium klotzschianum]
YSLSGSKKLVLREVFTSVQGSGPLPGYIRTYVFVEDNAAVQTWSETTQQEKGDSLAEGYVSEFYGDLPYLLDAKVDKHLFRALAQFWNPAYSCFTFGRVDLGPTVEQYTALLHCSKIHVDKA